MLLAWQANIDIQYVLNAHACVMYVASYREIHGWIVEVLAAERRTNEFNTQWRKVGSDFLTHRELSAQEAVY